MASSLPPDPWKILGVDKAADKSDIRAAYKKLVLKCHPDKVQDPTLKAKKQEEFQKVQQAYELLNDDTERAKYEQKQKLADLQRAAAKVQQEARNSPNTSVPRTSTRYATFDIRTAEPTSRYTSSPSGGKVYTHYTTTHTRSHEEVPSSRVYTLYDETDKQARRTASYEKPSRKDEERRDRDREERKRRKEDEEFNRIREKDRAYERERDKERERAKAEYEKEKEREARKAEKKRLDKERERERRRETEDKARRHKPYVEPYADAYADAYLDELWLEDEKYVSARSDKKRSSSRKHEETREREKSSSRRAKSPHLNPDSLDRKGRDNQSYAAAYIMLSKSQTSQSSYLPHPAPTPPPAPPVDFVEDDSLRHAAARAAGRRSSNDAARSREKLRTYELDPATPTSTTPKSARPIPTLKQSYSTPPNAPESPPRVSRSQTVPHDLYARPIPSLQRNQTWAAGSGGGLAGMEDRRAADYYDDYDSDDDRDRRHRRSGRDRRARSPSAQVAAVQAAAAAATQRYKVEGVKTSKLDPYPSVYGGTGESPTSRRYAANAAAPAAATGGVSPGVVGVMEGGMSPSATATYQGTPFRVKEAKTYGPADVKYSEYGQPSYYYSSHGGEGYPVVA